MVSTRVKDIPIMADLTARSGTGKRAEFLSWIGCLLLFISLPCISAKCMGADISVSFYPAGDIQVEYGSPLELFCIVDGNYSVSDIAIVQSGKSLETEIVNSTTRRLYIEMPEKQSSIYYCRNTKSKKMCVARVIVDSPPTDVTDFKCLSNNFDTLNCSWTRPASFSVVNYTLAFGVNNLIILPYCVPSQIEFTNYCVWYTYSLPRYRSQVKMYFFYMNACNVLGCHSQNFTIDHFSIVKPDRPFDLRVVKHSPHSVLLKWRIPNNIIDFLECGVDHIIQYQIANVDNRTHFHTVDTSNLPSKNKTYTFYITDLPYAHTQYEVRIYIKSKQAISREFWSEYEYIVFTTASEIPARPPQIIAGAFDQLTNGNQRVITVYWQDIEEIEEAGPNFTYKVLVNQDSKTKVIYSDKNKSGSYVSLHATLDELDITVWSYNINGTSINSSHIYIPPEKDTHSLKVTSLTKLAYENGTYELLWDGVKNIDNYTLFWCEHDGTQKCAGPIHFDVLDSSKTRHVINLPIEHFYQFALSANSGMNSGGMTWAKIYGTHSTQELRPSQTTPKQCECTC